MIRELKTLIAVARQGTFAAAGQKIGLTQAAVSAQMKRLESELGFSLFDRTGRSAQLNSRGRQTLTQAEELLRFYQALGSPDRGRSTTALINLGAIDSVQRSALPEVLARFHKEFPGYRTRVAAGLSVELFNLVDAGDIEMAAVIRPPFTLQSDLRWTTLAHEPFRLIVPRHIRQNDWGELLSNQPFVRYERASFGGRQVDRFLRRAHITVRELCELGELSAIVRLVARGAGIALVPQTVDHVRWPAGVRAIDLGDHTFYRDIGLIHRAGSMLSEPARTIAQMFGEAYRSEYGKPITGDEPWPRHDARAPVPRSRGRAAARRTR
jgi:DNA-binding transcriptional LysR family regulator